MRMSFLIVGLAALLTACANLPSSGRAGTGAAAPQILVTAKQSQPSAFALVGDPSLAYQRRRGYGATPEVDRLLDELADDYGLKRVEGWLISSLGVYCEVYELAPGQSTDDLIARVSADPRVDSAQAMNVFSTQGVHYNDPYASLQPALRDLSLDVAHESATGRGVRVAVVDSAVDDRHPEMRGRVSLRRDLVARHRVTGRAEIHGTATAGIIASAANNAEGIVGVAPDAEIVGLRACWTVDERTGRASCSSLSLALALETAIALEVDVVNLSLAGPRDPLLERLIDRAIADGVIVVAALPDGAGQDGFPASHPGVIAVGSSAASNLLLPNLLLAPGSEVLSTVPGAAYGFFSGNSMSAAFVAGVAALLVERRPGIGAAEALARLAASSVAGSINACLAVAELPAGDCSELSDDPPLAALSRTPR